MNLYEKTIKEECVFKGKILDLRIQTVELPNGRTSTREIIKHPGAVAILAFKENGKLIVVQQYRKALEMELLEIPAGKLEYGEKPEDCAKRELEEETGFKSDNIEFLGKICTAPGFCDEVIHIFKATNLYEGNIGGDDDEFINLKEMSIDELKENIINGSVIDAKTISALAYL